MEETTIEAFDTVDVIRTKRDDEELSTTQIDWVIDAYTRGWATNEQTVVLAMAVFVNSMNRREIFDWTKAMIASGERLDFGSLLRPIADKHSTGGVGDKTTLPLAPLAANFGVAAPQLSGRGLGHTGGTLDKLEVIPGWQAGSSNEKVVETLGTGCGAVVCAAGVGLAPIDKRLYASRDITSTVDCVPLIASSIMSKKIAEESAPLVLDVKVGPGAFMKNVDKAWVLTETMVALGKDTGIHIAALLTDMSTPLGYEVGSASEASEAVEVLVGGGPMDAMELIVALAREMSMAAGKPEADPVKALAPGVAMGTWRAMIRVQGGDLGTPLAEAKEHMEVKAERSGALSRLDALSVGAVSWRTGAGWARPGGSVQLGAGITLHAKPGDTVTAGQTLFTLHSSEPQRFARALEALESGWETSDSFEGARSLIIDRIS